MEHFKVNNADVFFDDLGNGKGKLIISDDEYGYNFSYYWGSMGCNLKQFLKSIDSGYFVKKLSNVVDRPINVKKTFIALRVYLQECLSYELKWYQHTEFQKDFRKKLKEFQNNVDDKHHFIDLTQSFHNELDFYLIENVKERREVEKLFERIFSQSEPWNFICSNAHPEEIYLKNIHKKLQKTLKKPVQLCLF